MYKTEIDMGDYCCLPTEVRMALDDWIYSQDLIDEYIIRIKPGEGQVEVDCLDGGSLVEEDEMTYPKVVTRYFGVSEPPPAEAFLEY